MPRQGLLSRNEWTPMINISFKLLIICFMVGFGLFFGLDVAHKRIPGLQTVPVHNTLATPVPQVEINPASTGEQGSGVIGPMTAATARRQAETAQLQAQQTTQTVDQPTIVLQDSFINSLTNHIGDIFRRLASVLLHVVVAFFKFLLG
jgi:hypothetical protein